MGETSTKPYLIRALHEWCTDNGYTPYITVQVDEHTMVPMAHVRDGQITLNVGTLATNRLVLGNEFIEFQARFSGDRERTFPWAPSAPSMRARPAPAWASKCSPTSRRPLARKAPSRPKRAPPMPHRRPATTPAATSPSARA